MGSTVPVNAQSMRLHEGGWGSAEERVWRRVASRAVNAPTPSFLQLSIPGISEQVRNPVQRVGRAHVDTQDPETLRDQ